MKVLTTLILMTLMTSCGLDFGSGEGSDDVGPIRDELGAGDLIRINDQQMMDNEELRVLREICEVMSARLDRNDLNLLRLTYDYQMLSCDDEQVEHSLVLRFRASSFTFHPNKNPFNFPYFEEFDRLNPNDMSGAMNRYCQIARGMNNPGSSLPGQAGRVPRFLAIHEGSEMAYWAFNLRAHSRCQLSPTSDPNLVNYCFSVSQAVKTEEQGVYKVESSQFVGLRGGGVQNNPKRGLDLYRQHIHADCHESDYLQLQARLRSIR